MDVREKSLNEKRLIYANALQRVLLPITSALEEVFHWWMEDGVLPGQANI